MKLYRAIKNMFRRPIVMCRIKTGRYVPVRDGYNAFHDMKHDGILVKGYYDKPFSFTSDIFKFDDKEKR
jgi:hypothetical protein